MRRLSMFVLGGLIAVVGLGIRSSFAQLEPCFGAFDDCSRRPRPKRPPPPKLYEVWFTMENGQKACLETPKDCPDTSKKVKPGLWGTSLSIVDESEFGKTDEPMVINQPVAW